MQQREKNNKVFFHDKNTLEILHNLGKSIDEAIASGLSNETKAIYKENQRLLEELRKSNIRNWELLEKLKQYEPEIEADN
jgi:hypothetical protein